jgi:hypothetical protein
MISPGDMLVNLRRAVLRIGLALSRITNRLLGLIPPLRDRGFGRPGWPVSAVLGELEARGSGGARVFCGLLHWFDAQHCLEAWRYETRRED